MVKLMSKTTSLKHAVALYAFIFIIWGLYRLLFKLPEIIEEAILKPIVWLLPLVWVLRKEKQNLGFVGWTEHNLFKSIYLATGLGVLLAIEGAVVHTLKYGGSLNFLQVSPNEALFFGALGLSLITAVSEETVFRGFIFNRLWKILGEWNANIITSFAWTFVHLPVTIFVFKYDVSQMMTFLILTFLFGIISAFVFARTQNVLSSVLLHVFWEWPIILFR